MPAPRSRLGVLSLCLLVATASALGAAPASPNDTPRPPAPVFDPVGRAVSTWRKEAADHLALTPDQAAAMRGTGAAPPVARCVKLNNYWCIKTAGWDGELAADEEGHVAFASATEGAAVAALLLKRYYVDFNRRTAMAIISHWAPAQCGFSPKLAAAGGKPDARLAKGRGKAVRPVAARLPRMMPTIAVGLGEAKRPMTLDAMMMTSRTAPPSRSMIGMPRGGWGPIGKTGVKTTIRTRPAFSISGCGSDAGRIAAYAAKAVEGITPGADGDLALFDADGQPTANLGLMMTNMARVEIGPLGPTRALIDSGIASAFRPGRNPTRTTTP